MAFSAAVRRTLSDNRRQYKLDQRELARSMITTASQTRDIPELLEKPRDLVTRLLEGNEAHSILDCCRSWTVLVQDIEKAHSNSAQELYNLATQLTLLDDCIRLRQENGFIYKQAADKDATRLASNARHEAFLSTLIFVRLTLLSLRKPTPDVQLVAAETAAPLCIKWDVVAVEEPSEDLQKPISGLDTLDRSENEDPVQLAARQESESAFMITLTTLKNTRAEVCVGAKPI